jgi:hypothetical protein
MIAMIIEVLLVYYPFTASAICSLGLISGNSRDNLYCDIDLQARQKVGVCKRKGTAEGLPCEYLMLKKLDSKV